MKSMFFTTAATLALAIAAPATAQLLGGGLGGQVGGALGGITGSAGGSLGGTLDHGGATLGGTLDAGGRAARPDRRVNGRLGERRIEESRSLRADGALSLDRQMLNTRGAVAASRRGLRRVEATRSGVQVFVPPVAIAGPALPPLALVERYPAYAPGYYYGPDAVIVDEGRADAYMDRQYRDLETGLRGTGARVERRGPDLVVQLPADVTFAFDKSDIQPRFYGALNTFARTMRDYPATDVEVVGHTDNIGSDSYNLSLSERRGRSVADFLAGRQANPTRMVVEAMGESEPIATNATIEGRAANRRVELIVHPRAG